MNIFENTFLHIPELDIKCRMIEVDPQDFISSGPFGPKELIVFSYDSASRVDGISNTVGVIKENNNILRYAPYMVYVLDPNMPDHPYTRKWVKYNFRDPNMATSKFYVCNKFKSWREYFPVIKYEPRAPENAWLMADGKYATLNFLPLNDETIRKEMQEENRYNASMVSRLTSKSKPFKSSIPIELEHHIKSYLGGKIKTKHRKHRSKRRKQTSKRKY